MDIIPTNACCKVSFNKSTMQTIIGEVIGSKEFRVTATIEFVSNGDFSLFEGIDQKTQEQLNYELGLIISSKLIEKTIEL